MEKFKINLILRAFCLQSGDEDKPYTNSTLDDGTAKRYHDLNQGT